MEPQALAASGDFRSERCQDACREFTLKILNEQILDIPQRPCYRNHRLADDRRRTGAGVPQQSVAVFDQCSRRPKDRVAFRSGSAGDFNWNVWDRHWLIRHRAVTRHPLRECGYRPAPMLVLT